MNALLSKPVRLWRRAERSRAVLPMLFAVCLCCAGSSMLMTAVSLRLGQGDIDPTLSQIVLTVYPIGFLLGCMMTKPFVVRFGHEAVFMAVLGFAFLSGLGFVLFDSLAVWIALRFAGGLAMAAMFVICESWMNLFATQRDRGTMFGLYMISTSSAVLLGQVVIGLIGPTSPYVFEVALAFAALAFLPRVVGRRWPTLLPSDDADASVLPSLGRLRLAQLLRMAPVAVVGVFQSGITNMNVFVLTPIYSTQIGLPAATAVALVTTVSIAGMLAQAPVGWLSDRFDRRLILLMQSALALGCCFAIAAIGTGSVPLLFALFFLYGSAALTIYPVAVAHANANLPSRHMVAASGTFLLIYSVGNVGTPGLAAGLMASTAPQAMFAILGAGALAVALASAWSLLRRPVAAATQGAKP